MHSSLWVCSCLTSFFFFVNVVVYHSTVFLSVIVLCSFRRKSTAQDMSNAETKTETVLTLSWLSFPPVSFSDTSNVREQSILTPLGPRFYTELLWITAQLDLLSWNAAPACVKVWCWLWEVIIWVNFRPVDVAGTTLMEGHGSGTLSQPKGLWRF